MVDEATEEHDKVANLLAEMEELDIESEDWTLKIAELKQNVLHHVKEEEGEIFKKAKEIMGKDDMQTLGKEFQDAKKQAAAG